MNTSTFQHLLCLATLALSPLASLAQNPQQSANADLIRMIQAHLPESVVLTKIKASAASLDSSTDALLALKAAGATDAELTAVSDSAAAPTPAAQTSSPAAGAPVGVPLLGGMVTNVNGNVTFDIRGDPDGLGSLHFRLNSFEGAPALVTQLTRFKHGVGNPPCITGDLFINADHTTFYPYVLVEPTPRCDGVWRLIPDLTPSTNALNEARLPRLGKNGPQWYMWGYDFTKKDRPTPSRAFMDFLLRDFPGTILMIEQAAGITDLAHQLSPESQFHQLSKDEVLALIKQRQTNFLADHKMDGINAAQRVLQEQQEARLHPKPADSGGDGMLSLINAVQGVQNVKQSLNDVKIADATHSGAAQLQAAVNTGRTSAQALNSLDHPTTVLQATPSMYPAGQPAAPAPAPPAPGKSAFNMNDKRPAPSNGTAAARPPAPGRTTASSGTAAPPVAIPAPQSPYVASTPPLTPGFTTSLPIDNCVQQTYVDDNLSFVNHCTQAAYVEWYIGARSGSGNIAPGETAHSGYSSADVVAANGSRYYACPKLTSPVDAKYQRITSAVSNYTCRQF